jgi:hypothetical protein
VTVLERNFEYKRCKKYLNIKFSLQNVTLRTGPGLVETHGETINRTLSKGLGDTPA